MVTPKPSPSQRRLRGRAVAIPVVSAVVLAAIASYAEIRIVGSAYNACDVGINAANGLFLIIFNFPVLWVAQAVPIAVLAPPLTLLRVPRPAVTALMGLLAAAVVITVAVTFFVWSGLPIYDESCPGIQPAWWPGWLPPTPKPFY